MNLAIYKTLLYLLLICLVFIGCSDLSSPVRDNSNPQMVTLTPATPEELTTNSEIWTPTPSPQTLSSPKATPMPTETPIQTMTPLPLLVWAEGVEQVATIQNIDSDSLVWSPIANEFIAHDCWTAWDNGIDQQSIFRLAAPDFLPVNITPANFSCESPLEDMIWTTDATRVLFAGPFPEEHPLHPSNYGFDNSAIWIMERTGSDSHPLNLDDAHGRYVEFIDWIDEQTLVYKAYAGGGHHYIAMLDVNSGEPISWGIVHIGGNYQSGLNYIGTNTGMHFDSYINAVAIAQTMVNPDTIFDGGPFMLCVSCEGNPPDKPQLLDSNSRFEDWVPGTNKMLLLTWNTGERLLDIDAETRETQLNWGVETQLQIWDVDTHEVSMLVPQGMYGRFSADGQYLAFLTFAETSVNDKPHVWLHILRLTDKQVLLTLPIATPINEHTFFWAPISDRMIYRDEQDNWQILQVPDGSQKPVTLNGGMRLSFPQWSSDGQYLSATIRNETEGEVVIFRVP